MEPSNSSSDDRFPFSNPNANANATTSAFTFTTSSSVSGLSKSRFVKLRKHNNASAFNRDGGAGAGGGGANAAAAFVLGSASNLEKRISDQLLNLKIGNEGFENPVSKLPEEMMSKLKIVTEKNKGGFNARVESELGNELRKKLSIRGEEERIGGGSNAVTDENSSTNDVIDRMKNLNVNLNDSSSSLLVNQKKKEEEDSVEPNLYNSSVEGIHQTAASASAPSSVLFSSGTSFQPVGESKRDEFVFMSKPDSSGSSSFVEFKTTAPPKVGKEGKPKEKVSNVRMNKSRAKPKHCTPSQPSWHGQGFVFKPTSVSQEDSQGSYSPMEVSPYQEKLAENRTSRENSVTSNESFSVDSNIDSSMANDSFSVDNDNNSVANDLVPTTSIDPIEEDLIAVATKSLNINGSDYVACEETKEDPKDESLSGVETESFKSASDKVDLTSDDATSTLAETEANDGDRMLHQGSGFSSGSVSGSGFTFAASSSSAEAQLSSPKRHNNKKKNWGNVGHDPYNYTQNIKVPYSSSSVAFSPFSGTAHPTSGQGLKAKVSSPQPKTRDSDVNEEQGIREASASTSTATIAAQEACEKWRLR